MIDDEGVNHGTVPTAKALQMARERDLDLVVVSANQAPPVAKILDWGKYKYETEKRAKEAKKKQHTVDVKEVKMRYKIDVHDYEVRLKAAKKFLAAGNKVKVVLRMKGRQQSYKSTAVDVVKKFYSMLEANGTYDKEPEVVGRNVILIVNPKKN